MKPKKKDNTNNKRKKYKKENLQLALDAVRKGMSKKLASKTYNVPRGTIQSRLRKPCQDLPGPKPILSDEEETILVQWVIDCCRKGFPKRKSDLQLSVANFIKKSGRDNPFKDDIPGKKWYDLFMRRHPELSERTAEAVTSASANVSKEDIQGWFQKIEVYLKENNYFDILQEPSRVFNGDESNFQLCPKSGKVISLRGERDVYEIDHAAAKTALTVLFTFGADGDITPPLVVFPNKRLPKEITSSVPSQWGIGLSDTGWMKSELFHDYIKNVFFPYLIKRNVQFPVILFVDGHKTHLSLEVSELCSKLEIVLIALYPNATRILQPADVSAFRPLKVAWKDSVLKWRRDHPLESLTKNNFVPVLEDALEVGIKDSTVISGFRTTGLCPWNPEAINYKKCLGKGSKPYKEPNEDKLKPPKIVMTAETFEKIVGQEQITYLKTMPLESFSEPEKILKKICQYFEENETDVSTSQKDVSQIDDIEEFEILSIDQLPVILADDFEDELQINNTVITNESPEKKNEDCIESSQLVNLDNQSFLMTPVKLQDVLITEKTPERKGVRNVQRSSFVLTSAEWQKTENDKLKAKQLKEEEQESRKKNRLLKQQEKKKLKAETTKNKTDKTKIKETKAKKIKETKKQDSTKQEQDSTGQDPTAQDSTPQDSTSQDSKVMTHQVMIHDVQSNKKRKAEDESKFPPHKRIQIISDITLNPPSETRSFQVGQEDVKPIGDPLDKIINNKRKKNYSLLELEQILSED